MQLFLRTGGHCSTASKRLQSSKGPSCLITDMALAHHVLSGLCVLTLHISCGEAPSAPLEFERKAHNERPPLQLSWARPPPQHHWPKLAKADQTKGPLLSASAMRRDEESYKDASTHSACNNLVKRSEGGEGQGPPRLSLGDKEDCEQGKLTTVKLATNTRLVEQT